MIKIKEGDLFVEISKEDERNKKETMQQEQAKVISTLLIENNKKDIQIAQMSKTIANLNIEVAKLKQP